MKKITSMLLLIHSGFIIAQTKTVVTQFGEKVVINPYLNNGLTAENGFLQFGGSLLKPTTLATTASYTLALEGLQIGAMTNKLLSTNANGVVSNLPNGTEGQYLTTDASGNLKWDNLSAKNDATRYLGGTVYSTKGSMSGGVISTDRVIGKAIGTSYTVGINVSAKSNKGGIVSLRGQGYTISNPVNGMFDIQFDTPLDEIYGISVNILDSYIDGSSFTVSPDSAGLALSTTDNSQVAFISNSIIRIKTGNSSGGLENRSFTFLITGK